MWHCLNESSKLVKRWRLLSCHERPWRILSQPAWMVYEETKGKKGGPGSSPILLLKRGVRKLEPTRAILWTWKNHKHRSPRVKLEPFGMQNDMHSSTKLRAVDFCNHLLWAVCRWVWLGPLGPLLSPNTKVFNVMLAHINNKNEITSQKILVA